MLYAALAFWLFIIVCTAWGVHSLLTRLVKPRIVNFALLPGTLVATLGYVFGLLITGNEVRRASLIGDSDTGEPTSDPPDKHKIPVLGSIVVGLLPIVACAGGLYAAKSLWGAALFERAAGVRVTQTVPTTLDGVWDLLRQSITAMEGLLDAILGSDLANWETLLFVYLALCLTVRMAPLERNRRGAIVAIVLAAGVIWLIGLITSQAAGVVEAAWPIVSFAVALLLLMLLITLLVTGLVGLVRVLRKDG